MCLQSRALKVGSESLGRDSLEDGALAAVATHLQSGQDQLQYVLRDLLEGGERREGVGCVHDRNVRF